MDSARPTPFVGHCWPGLPVRDEKFASICTTSTGQELLALCLKGMSWIHGCILFMVYSQMACISGASTDLALTCRPEFFSRALQPSPSVSLGGAI